MILNQTDIGKFSFAEAMNSPNGKTSGSKLAGLIGLSVGSIGFIAGTIGLYFKMPSMLEVCTLSAGLITTSFVLFGYTKKKDTNDITNTILEQ